MGVNQDCRPFWVSDCRWAVTELLRLMPLAESWGDVVTLLRAIEHVKSVAEDREAPQPNIAKGAGHDG